MGLGVGSARVASLEDDFHGSWTGQAQLSGVVARVARRCVVGAEGLSEPTRKVIEKQFDSLVENEVLATLYRGGAPAARLAKLAPTLARDAQSGEPYALQALKEQTAAMASIVRTHFERFHGQKRSLNICLAGGLWEASPVFQSQLEAALCAAFSEVELAFSRVARPPVHGAVRLAQELER